MRFYELRRDTALRSRVRDQVFHHIEDLDRRVGGLSEIRRKIFSYTDAPALLLTWDRIIAFSVTQAQEYVYLQMQEGGDETA